MLSPWLDLPGTTDLLAAWSEAAGLDLLSAGTTASADEIKDTAVAQPLLTAAALLSARALLGDQPDAVPGAVCGHSIGELPALAVAGVLAPADAVRLAALRGHAMADAAGRQPTGMTAVLGGDQDALQQAAEAHGLEVATVNAPGNVVLGGTLDQLASFTPPGGGRLRPLAVAGAFHTRHMLPAVQALDAAVAATDFRRPRCRVLANADGAAVIDPDALRARLVAQLTRPVRFDLCLEAMRELGTQRVVELAPGGVLTALVKRNLPGAEVVALKGAGDLDAARALVAADGAGAESPDLAWRVVEATSAGNVDLVSRTGDQVGPGSPMAVVRSRGGEVSVSAPHAGTVQEWLVGPGDPVRPGTPLAVLS